MTGVQTCALPIFWRKKNDEAIGDIKGLMYPFSSSSWSHLCNALSTLGGNGYNLQSMMSGASGFGVMVWSHGRDGGSFFDSTGLKILACLWYSSGTSTSWVNFPASLDNSIEIPLSEDSRSSSWNVASRRHCVLVWTLCPRTILVITGLICDFSNPLIV